MNQSRLNVVWITWFFQAFCTIWSVDTQKTTWLCRKVFFMISFIYLINKISIISALDLCVFLNLFLWVLRHTRCIEEDFLWILVFFCFINSIIFPFILGSPSILTSPPPSPSCSHPNANGDVFFPRSNSTSSGSSSSSSSIQPQTPTSIRMHDDYRSAQWSPRAAVPRRR